MCIARLFTNILKASQNVIKRKPKKQKEKEPEGLKNTIQIRLYPTREQARNSWTFYQLTQFIIYKAARLGIKVEMVDPAYTSQECPACKHWSIADDRAYECRECGWKGHRDIVGAMSISRRTSLDGKSQGAMGA